MGEVLSQNEIDNLLAALSSGEIDAEDMSDTSDKQVKNYDFKRPTKFSKEHLRTLEIIYEHYGRLLSTSLPIYLRKNIQITVASSETVIFSEFTNALSNPVIRKMLKEFSGAVISVSHDRKYMAEVCDTIYELSEEGCRRCEWYEK